MFRDKVRHRLLVPVPNSIDVGGAVSDRYETGFYKRHIIITLYLELYVLDIEAWIKVGCQI